jgi:hypothetical protein
MVLRDEVWDSALEKLMNTGEFKLTDLPFEPSEIFTVRRCVREMESRGWLLRESEHADIWRAGPKAEMLMNLTTSNRNHSVSTPDEGPRDDEDEDEEDDESKESAEATSSEAED